MFSSLIGFDFLALPRPKPKANIVKGKKRMIINSNSDEDSSEEEAKANRLNSLTTKHWEHGVLVESVQPLDQ